MHKSSTSVWKAARANVPELPDSFPGMDEPQFVNLAFDQHCHVSVVGLSDVVYSKRYGTVGVFSLKYSLRGLAIAYTPLP